MADSSSWWRNSSVEATHIASESSGQGREAYCSRPTENSKASTWNARQQHGTERTIKPKSTFTYRREWSYTSPDSSTDGELHSSYRYTGSQLTAKLRSASTARALQVLLKGHAGILSGQHLSAAFKALSVMHAPRDEVQSLLQEHLLPALNSMLAAAQTAAAAATSTSTSTGKAHQHTRSTASDSDSVEKEVVLDGRACAVILTSLLSLKDSLRPVQQQQQQAYQRHQAYPCQHYNITQLAADLVDVFLSPAVQATATPQAFCMVASAAAKLRLRSVSAQQIQQLLCGFLTAAEDARIRSPDLLEPLHVSQTLWGVATLLSAQGQSPPSPGTQQMLCDAALLLTQQPELYAAAKPVELVNTLCAFAIAEASPPPGLVRDLLDALEANLDRAIPQDISRALWAVARTNSGQEATPRACVRALSALCRPPVLARVTSQDVSNTLWGAANIQQQRQSGAGGDEEPQGQQQGCIDPEQIEALATKFMQLAEQRQVTQTDVSAMCWALAALGAQLPGDLMQQLFQTYMTPHILDQVDRDPTVSTGITNILWAAATLNKPSGRQHWRQGRQGQQQLLLLSTADLETLAGMLLMPRRLKHLTAADISITTSSLAHLGFSWTQQQLSALLQRFLQPGARSAALPKNFQNVLWGVIRMKQEAVLQQDGILQQLVQAWFASSGPRGLWSEADADPTAAANVLWAVAIVSKGEDTHEKRWLDIRSNKDIWRNTRNIGAAADGEAAPLAAAASILDETCSSSTAAAAAEHRTQYVSKQLLQRLFDSFLQHRNLAAANTIDISTVMWAAAVLNQPLPQDDLQWLLSAFMQPERLEAASAMSIANMMYGLTHLQLQHRQKLQDQQGSEAAISLRPQSSTSSSIRGRQGLSTVGAQQASSGYVSSFSSSSAQQESTAPVLAALSNQLLHHIPDVVTRDDISAALLALTRAYVVLQASSDSSSSRAHWVLQHQRQLQEALWDLLEHMLPLMPSQDKGSSSTSAPAGDSTPCQHSDSSSSSSSSSPATSPVAWTMRRGVGNKVPAVGSFSQQLLQDCRPEPCTMHTLVDAVWACDSMGVAPPNFLAAVCRVALQPWGTSRRAAAAAAAAAGAGVSAQQPAVQQLPLSELVVLLEKLASLNWLSPVVWECALQPLLAACPAARADSAAGQAAHLSTSSSMDACSTLRRPTQEQVLVLGRATGVVPRLCWAAAVGDCQCCRSLVVLLCRAWACCLAQQYEQELGQQQGPRARSNSAVPGSAGLNGSSSSGGNSNSSSSSSGSGGGGSSSSRDCSAGVWFQQVGRESLCQLWQVHMWLQDTEAVQPTTTTTSSSSSSSKSEISSSSSSSSGLLGALSAEQLQLCEAAWKEQVGRVSTSRLQLGVAEVMRSIPGVSNVQLEGLTSDGCFSVDVMAEVVDVQALRAAAAAAAAGDSDAATAAASITGRDRPSGKASRLDSRLDQSGKGPMYQLAIEADGPSHFVLTSLPSVTGCETGSAVLRGEAGLRSRSLAARGYVVLRISYLDWWQQQQQRCKQLQREQQQQQQQEGVDDSGSGSADSKEGLADVQAWLAGCVCEAIAVSRASSGAGSSSGS